MHSRYAVLRGRQLLTLALLFSAGPTYAQEPPARQPAPATAQPATAAPPAEAPPPRHFPLAENSTPWVAGYNDGFFLRSGDDAFRLRLAGYAQADGRFALDDSAQAVSDSLLVRRARTIFQGTVARHFDFYLCPDFGGGSTVLQDAYLDVNFDPRIRLRAGKIKTPFGIERLQSGASLWFVERALPNNLVPNRDVGLQLHGELGKGAFAYQLAVLNGAADGGSADGDTNDSKDLAARLFLQPWRARASSPLRGLGFGFAATHGAAGAGSLAASRSVSQVSVFSYASGVTATGDRRRLSPQAYFFLGPVGLLAEYVESRQSAVRQAAQQDASSPPTTTVAPLRHSAWSVSGGFFLTGEDARYGSPRPRKSFVPSDGTWGALQLVARVNRIDLDADAFTSGFADPAKSASRATAWAVGLNWIWNTNLRYVLDYEQTRFKGGAAAGADRPSEKSLQTRLQLSF